MISYPKITVVTVVYNNEKYIEATLKSVFNQTYENIEYVVIDAGSKDRTLEIIGKYSNRIDVFISESDKGIYDGMNKGIHLSSGDFIIFLNSGDVFYNSEIIQKLSGYVLKLNNVDIIYGDVGAISNNFDFMKIIKSNNIKEINKGMVMNHQSCLISRALHLKYKYDLTYKLASDYHFILRNYLLNSNIVQIPEIISVITDGGVSDINRLSVFREKLKIKNDLNFSYTNYLDFCFESGYMYFASFVKKILPRSIVSKVYKMKYKV